MWSVIENLPCFLRENVEKTVCEAIPDVFRELTLKMIRERCHLYNILILEIKF